MNNRRNFIKLATGCIATSLSLGYSKGFAMPNDIAERTKINNKLPFKNSSSYQKWLWIELIGFDNAVPDYGVKDFIDNTGFVPEAISFLLFTPDFVHAHKGMKEEWVFPPEYCSYNARPFSKERPRQAWTNYQLRGLITELHKYDIEVYCSFFDFVVDLAGEGRWSKDYPEIFETGRDGDRYSLIHPLKRFKDQTYYEDFFIERLVAAVKDYGFDGFHGADGYSSGRRPLDDIDYSDDMIEQFTRHSKVALPNGLMGSYDNDKVAFGKRSRWVWKNKKKEWILFHTYRWEVFWKKVVDQLHAIDRKVVVNTAWTRAPFEAVYRYGINYNGIAKTGVDGIVIEASASAVAMEPTLSDDYLKFHYNAMAMFLLIKAQCPDIPLRPFTGIHDTLEQYDALRHVPTVVEREIYSMANLYLDKGNNNLVRCSSGPLGCLSDSVADHEWNWLKEKWDIAFSSQAQHMVGATLVWSEDAFNNQLDDYIETRRWSTHKLLYELMTIGTPIYSVINIKDIGNAQGPLVVLNPNLFSKSELNKVLSYTKGSVVLIGGDVSSVNKSDVYFEDSYGPNTLSCSVYGAKKTYNFPVLKKIQEVMPETVPDPFSWTESLYFQKVSTEFLDNCRQVLSDVASAPKVVTAKEFIRIMTLKETSGNLRLLIGSDSFYYETPQIDVGQKIKKINVVTPFPGVPVLFDESKFNVRIPGKGMVILDIDLA